MMVALATPRNNGEWFNSFSLYKAPLFLGPAFFGPARLARPIDTHTHTHKQGAVQGLMKSGYIEGYV